MGIYRLIHPNNPLICAIPLLALNEGYVAKGETAGVDTLSVGL